MNLGFARRAKRSATIASLGLLATSALGMSTLVTAPMAHAEGADKFIVSPVLESGKTPITVNDTVGFKFDWKVKPGETIAVGDVLEMEFGSDSSIVFTQNPPTFDLMTPRGQAAANCSVDRIKISCTFVESDIVGDGAENIHGSAQVEGRAVRSTESTTVPFTVNGVSNPLTLPVAGDGTSCVICDRAQGLGSKITKRGNVNLAPAGSLPPRVEWSITVPGPVLLNNEVGALTFSDTLSGDHEFRLGTAVEGNSYFRLSVYTADGVNRVDSFAISQEDISVSEDGKSVKLTVPEPSEGWNPEYKYQIDYFTFFPEDIIPAAGSTFINSFQIDGKEDLIESAQAQINSGQGVADAERRVGVTKTVSGLSEADSDLAQSKSFTFEYECALPSGATSSGEISAYGNGVTQYSKTPLELGAKCSVTEVADDTDIEGYKFVTEIAPVDVTTGAGTNVATFVNTYEPVAEPSPSATQDETPSAASVPSPSESSETTPAVTTEPSPQASETPQAAATPSQQSGSLANTGANVVVLVAVAALLLTTGAIVVARRRKDV